MITIPLHVFLILLILIFGLGVCAGAILEMGVSIKEMNERIATLQEIEDDYNEFLTNYKNKEE